MDPAIEIRENLLMKPLRWTYVLSGVAFLLWPAMDRALTQDPPSPTLATPAQESDSKTDKPSKKKYSHKNDFVIRGTVFNEKALSFSGVELQFRSKGEKKYRWNTYTNSHGEFAVRVPQGSNYEILVHVKGFVDQKRTIDANNGQNEETVTFRLQPVAGGKE